MAPWWKRLVGGLPALRARPAPCAAFSIVLAHLLRRQYRHSENGRFLIQTERTRDLVADSRGSRPQLMQQPKPLRPK
jgi:hypothetical protein